MKVFKVHWPLVFEVWQNGTWVTCTAVRTPDARKSCLGIFASESEDHEVVTDSETGSPHLFVKNMGGGLVGGGSVEGGSVRGSSAGAARRERRPVVERLVGTKGLALFGLSRREGS